MKILSLLAVAFVLAGCQCGPGVSCKSDTSCEPWGVCGASGFCVSRATQGDGGIPRAVVPITQVDLGRVGCGVAPKTQKITVTNAGTGTLRFTTTLINGSIFSIAPAAGELTAEQTVELTVSGLVPGSTVANTELTGVLTLNLNEDGRSKIDIPLKLKSSGVTLTLMPTVVAFGASPIGDAPQTESVVLTNLGNLSATLSFTQPTDDQFALAWTGLDGGSSLTLAPLETVPGLEARFTARRIAPATTFAQITVAEPVCGSSVGAIPMSGRGQNGVLELSETELFFGNAGRVDCNSTASPRTFTLRNAGNAVFSWSGSLARGATSPFVVSPNMGTVFASADAGLTLTVTPQAVPAVASTAAEAFGDTFVITTSIAGDSPHAITLHQTANGAVLSFSSPTVDFGLVPIGDTASAPVGVINDGNAAVGVSFSSNNSRFALNPFGPLSVDAGTSNSYTATFKPDASMGKETGDVRMMVADGGLLCSLLPAPLAMSGAGSTGSVSYTPIGLAFGTVNCGSTAPSQTVTFKNAGNQNYTITPVLGIADGGASFSLLMNPASGVVASDGGTVVITVQPRLMPQDSPVTLNLFADTLTVTTSVSGDSPHLIALSMTARGAIFGISTSSINFGATAVGGARTSQFTIDNTGNAPGDITFAVGQPMSFSMPRDAGVAANASFTGTGTFSPQMVGPYTDTATITVPASTVLCRPLPFTSVGLGGQGTTSNALTLSSTSLTFGSAGLVPCGTTAAARAISITNNSAYLLALTLSLGIADGGSPYTVVGPTALGAADAGAITVSPEPRPNPSSTAADFYADTLSIRAVGGPVDETQVVALHQTAQGAILVFNPTALTFVGGLGQTQQKNFTVSNVGNLTAPYTLSLGGANPGAFSVNPTSSSVSPGTGVTQTVIFTGELLSPKRLANIAISPNVALCGPLPAAVQLTGN